MPTGAWFLAAILTGIVGSYVVFEVLPARQAAQTRPAVHVISMADYLRLEPGMMEWDAMKILKRPGTETGKQSIGGLTITSYEWVNPDGSVLAVTFHNFQLASRVQRGLK